MKRLFISALIMLATATAWAVPARRTVRTVVQPDGTSLTLTQQGDEWQHYFTDQHGTPMELDAESGWWRPAVIDTEASRAIRTANANRRAQRARVIKQRPEGASVGNKKALVILAEFQDVKFTTENAQATYNDIFNAEGYSDYGMGGSVRDYFLAQSYGQLSIDFDVVGPVTLPENMEYYGKNRGGNDIRPGTFATHAIQQADELTDYAQYDWDGDGEVDQVFIIFAGRGENNNPDKLPNCIWPHEWTLHDARYGESATMSGALYLDGVKVDTYACSNELYGTTSIKVDGIGTACHEFSHCIGLPDMYDTNGQAFGMDQWDMMDYGCYNGNGYVPASYTAYERWYAGWIEPVVLDEPCYVSGMKNIDEDGECYIIYNRAHANEYYMLQNIQQTGWNAGAAAEGMLVIHVDYSASVWSNNKVNCTASHQRMSPVCADNSWDYNDNDGDLWPWHEKDSLTDMSAPSADLFNYNDDGSKKLGRPITGIKHEGGLVSFSFNGGKEDTNGGNESPVRPIAIASGTKRAYDLQGRNVKHYSHGIYIIDGKKVVK